MESPHKTLIIGLLYLPCMELTSIFLFLGRKSEIFLIRSSRLDAIKHIKNLQNVFLKLRGGHGHNSYPLNDLLRIRLA